MMRPIELAKSMMRDKGIDFEKSLMEHMGSALAAVIIRPDLFAMGYVREMEHCALVERTESASAAPTNFQPINSQLPLGWNITMAVGDLRKLVGVLPFELPFIAFTRHKGSGRYRIYRTDRFLKLSTKAAHRAAATT